MAEHYLEVRFSDWVEVQRKDVHFRIYEDGKLFGTLKVSQGSIDWSPANSVRERPHSVYWNEFDEFARTKRRKTKILSASVT